MVPREMYTQGIISQNKDKYKVGQSSLRIQEVKRREREEHANEKHSEKF